MKPDWLVGWLAGTAERLDPGVAARRSSAEAVRWSLSNMPTAVWSGGRWEVFLCSDCPSVTSKRVGLVTIFG